MLTGPELHDHGGHGWAEGWCPDALVPGVGDLRDSGAFTDTGYLEKLAWGGAVSCPGENGNLRGICASTGWPLLVSLTGTAFNSCCSLSKHSLHTNLTRGSEPRMQRQKSRALPSKSCLGTEKTVYLLKRHCSGSLEKEPGGRLPGGGGLELRLG